MSGLQLDKKLLNHVQVNLALGSTRQSEIVRAAANILNTKQTAGNLLTVKQLISKYHQSVKSSLDDSRKQDAGSIPCEPLVLLGRLSPGDSLGDHYSGEIIFSDGTSSIVCETSSSVSLECLGKIVLLFNWNYILSEPVPLDIISTYQKNSTTERNQLAYLEISECCMLEDDVSVPPALPDVVHSVNLLEQWIGERSSPVGELNIYGRLVANSSLYKPTEKGRVFMIQLTDNHSHHSCHIIIQERHLLHFTNLLIIGRTYMFTNVHIRNMTYTKQNVKVERRVLSTTVKSTISEYTEQSSSPKTETSSATSNSSNSGSSSSDKDTNSRKRSYCDVASDDSQPKKLHSEASSESHNVMLNVHEQEGYLKVMTSPIVGYDSSSVVSYTGVITKFILPEAGIYELDSKVQLFLTHKPCLNLCRGLRVGATVQLDNIHPTKLTRKNDESSFAFCCCSRSSIKVVSFSSLDTPYEPFVAKKSLIASYGRSLSLEKFQWLLEVYLSLKDKLSLLDSHCRNDHVRKVLAALYKDSGLVGNRRDIYEEYLAVPHHCPSTVAVTSSPHPASEWRLYTIKELLTALQNKVEERSVVFKSGDSLPSYKEKLRTTQNTQVLWSYGIISCNKFNPPIMLVAVVHGSESTGRLVLQDATGEIDLLLCTSYCNEHSVTEKQWTITNVPKLFGMSVIIRKWYVVVERITDPKNNVSDSIYVVCSEEDMFTTSIPRKSSTSSSSYESAYISEIYKQPLILRCDQSSVSLNFTLECCVHDNQSLHASKSANKTYLNCRGQQLCLYPFLHYSCTYETLSKESDLLRNATYVGGSPGVNGDILEVTDLVSSYKLCHDVEKFEVRIVNFMGVLINRKFCLKQNLDIPAEHSGLPGIKEGTKVYIKELGCGPILKESLTGYGINPIYSQVKVVLEIEGRCFPDTLLIYYDLTLTPEPVGLIPGTLLLFTHFQLTCNYGRLSCSSSALSKVEVLAVEYKVPHPNPGLSYTTGFSKEQLHKSSTASLFVTHSNDVSLKVTAMHTSLLSMLTNKLLGRLLTHACVKLRCVIVTILWVRIQYKCVTCDKLVIDETCAPYCSLQQPKFSAECKLIISDGSGEALLYCYDSLVPTALACNMSEWHGVEDKTKKFGELTYQKPKKTPSAAIQTHYGKLSTEEGSANMLLATISSKQTVSRNVILCATPFLTTAEAFTPGTRTRPIYVNKMCHDTLVLPRIQLRAMVIGPVDCLMECRRLLQQLEKCTA